MPRRSVRAVTPKRRSPRASPPPRSRLRRRRPPARPRLGRRHRANEPPAGIHVPAGEARRPGRRRRPHRGVGDRSLRGGGGRPVGAAVRVGRLVVRPRARRSGDPRRRRSVGRVRAARDAGRRKAVRSVRTGASGVRGARARIGDHRLVGGPQTRAPSRSGVGDAPVELDPGGGRGGHPIARERGSRRSARSGR